MVSYTRDNFSKAKNTGKGNILGLIEIYTLVSSKMIKDKD